MDLNGVSALVTGGASGIGAASVRALARTGARCVIVDRNEQLGNEVAAEVGGLCVVADVASEDEVAAAVATAGELGPLRVVVNAAGMGSRGRTIDRDGTPFPLDNFERVVRVNLIGTFNCIRLAASAIAATDPIGADGARGAIVNIASIAAFDGQIGQAAYSASKGGIAGMTLPIARDLAAVGIRVNTIAPGLIDTPIYGRGDQADAFKAKLAGSALFPRRLGSPEELASMVLELITNDFMNGEVIRVDGGIRLAPK